MEWVEVTGRTLEEAKEAALDQLGVDEQDAEFEVLEEPRAGLFGRLRSEARVCCRRPHGRRSSGGNAAGAATVVVPGVRPSRAKGASAPKRQRNARAAAIAAGAREAPVPRDAAKRAGVPRGPKRLMNDGREHR